MRLVNQKLNRSFNLDDLTIYVKGSEIDAHDGHREWILGEYESPERAKQVFIEIHQQMDGICLFENCTIDESAALVIDRTLNNLALQVDTSDGQPRVEMVNASVIYMPKE